MIHTCKYLYAMHAVFEKVEKYVKRCYNKIEADVLSYGGIIISSLLDEQDFFLII